MYKAEEIEILAIIESRSETIALNSEQLEVILKNPNLLMRLKKAKKQFLDFTFRNSTYRFVTSEDALLNYNVHFLDQIENKQGLGYVLGVSKSYLLNCFFEKTQMLYGFKPENFSVIPDKILSSQDNALTILDYQESILLVLEKYITQNDSKKVELLLKYLTTRYNQKNFILEFSPFSTIQNIPILHFALKQSYEIFYIILSHFKKFQYSTKTILINCLSSIITKNDISAIENLANDERNCFSNLPLGSYKWQHYHRNLTHLSNDYNLLLKILQYDLIKFDSKYSNLFPNKLKILLDCYQLLLSAFDKDTENNICNFIMAWKLNAQLSLCYLNNIILSGVLENPNNTTINFRAIYFILIFLSEIKLENDLLVTILHHIYSIDFNGGENKLLFENNEKKIEFYNQYFLNFCPTIKKMMNKHVYINDPIKEKKSPDIPKESDDSSNLWFDLAKLELEIQDKNQKAIDRILDLPEEEIIKTPNQESILALISMTCDNRKATKAIHKQGRIFYLQANYHVAYKTFFQSALYGYKDSFKYLDLYYKSDTDTKLNLAEFQIELDINFLFILKHIHLQDNFNPKQCLNNLPFKVDNKIILESLEYIDEVIEYFNSNMLPPKVYRHLGSFCAQCLTLFSSQEKDYADVKSLTCTYWRLAEQNGEKVTIEEIIETSNVDLQMEMANFYKYQSKDDQVKALNLYNQIKSKPPITTRKKITQFQGNMPNMVRSVFLNIYQPELDYQYYFQFEVDKQFFKPMSSIQRKELAIKEIQLDCQVDKLTAEKFFNVAHLEWQNASDTKSISEINAQQLLHQILKEICNLDGKLGLIGGESFVLEVNGKEKIIRVAKGAGEMLDFYLTTEKQDASEKLDRFIEIAKKALQRKNNSCFNKHDNFFNRRQKEVIAFYQWVAHIKKDQTVQNVKSLGYN